MTHQYPRIERDLRTLAARFTAGKLSARALPERLECLAAMVRMVREAEKSEAGEPNDFEATGRAYADTIQRLRKAGVAPGEGEFTFSPCVGEDE